jgi:hypothetical protein
MEYSFLPDWIYTFLILPIVILFQRYYSSSSRITVLENKDEINDDKFNGLCESVDELTKEVHELIGKLSNSS